ncbi:MAG: 4-alpha-glucanotransferase [Eubacteriales bacterium]|nr:4-alpha-glucanotransferase [Eubacteriales bacterium]
MNEKKQKLLDRRIAGILMHPTSLPGVFGIGDLGPESYAFVDFLKKSGQHIWQTLPLGPTGANNCPYQCFSSFAGQPLLVSPDLLVKDELLTEKDLENVPHFPEDHVDYDAVTAYKTELFHKAFDRFRALEEEDALVVLFQEFCDNTEWLDDYAMFMAIKASKHGLHWLNWEKKYRKPTKTQKKVIARELEEEILFEKFIQWLFFKQWMDLKAYANENDVYLVGDIPIFVSPDSADVWTEPKLFQVDSDGFPKVVAGVPPDYFSETGQLWGNPLYNWKYHKKNNYDWWMKRIKVQLELSDIVRIDHFRGLESYWEIPADAKTALEGSWKPGPRAEFFQTMIDTLGDDLPIIAEDLGIITEEVCALRDQFNLPGMKILQFAFEDDNSSYLPYNQTFNCICYTGTHDNDTSVGWYNNATEKQKDKVRRYMNTDASAIHWDFIRTCHGSPAKIAIVPVQDLLGQGSEYRMNIPGVAEGNWAYRLKKNQLNEGIGAYLKSITELYGR